MFQTVRIGRLFGIDTYIHWTFWILMLWVLVSETLSGGLAHGVGALVFLLSAFLCVYLHELGHAGAARHYGIRTRDITLMPIGGMARLEALPRDAWSELVVAIAGPAVNVAIAVLITLILLVAGGIGEVVLGNPLRLGFMQQLLALNVILVLFNLIPAFPMDGGRILRALLSLRMSHLQATSIAAKIGRYIALLMIVSGFFVGLSLTLVGVFVLIAGSLELLEAKRRSWLENYHGTSPFASEMPEAHNSPFWNTQPESSRGPIIDAEDFRRVE